MSQKTAKKALYRLNQIKMLNYSLLSNRYNVRKMNTNDVPLILSLCSNNEMYYRYYPPFPSEESIVRDLNALPPNKGKDDKYYLGFFDGSALIAVLDLIMSFPSKDIAFIVMSKKTPTEIF